MLPACETQDGVVFIRTCKGVFPENGNAPNFISFFPKIKNLVAKTLFMYYDKVQNVGVIYPMQTMMKRRLDNHELC